MTVKEQILAEILHIKDEAIYDTDLKSAKDLSPIQRRKSIFELEQEGKIQIIEKHHRNDESFPLLIAPIE